LKIVNTYTGDHKICISVNISFLLLFLYSTFSESKIYIIDNEFDNSRRWPLPARGPYFVISVLLVSSIFSAPGILVWGISPWSREISKIKREQTSMHPTSFCENKVKGFKLFLSYVLANMFIANRKKVATCLFLPQGVTHSANKLSLFFNFS
jgi:hypothetical protein